MFPPGCTSAVNWSGFARLVFMNCPVCSEDCRCQGETVPEALVQAGPELAVEGSTTVAGAQVSPNLTELAAPGMDPTSTTIPPRGATSFPLGSTVIGRSERCDRRGIRHYSCPSTLGNRARMLSPRNLRSSSRFRIMRSRSMG